MTPNEREVLAGLSPDPGQEPAWQPPMMFGGRDSTHHGLTAKRMIPKGWVERQGGPSPLSPRGSYRYRITPKGIEALANARATATGRIHDVRQEINDGARPRRGRFRL